MYSGQPIPNPVNPFGIAYEISKSIYREKIQIKEEIRKAEPKDKMGMKSINLEENIKVQDKKYHINHIGYRNFRSTHFTKYFCYIVILAAGRFTSHSIKPTYKV